MERPPLLTLNSAQLALEWTRIEHIIVKAIDPKEFDDVAWLKPNAELNSPNILRLVNFSNKITYWIITEILTPNDIHQRAAVIKFFLKMGEELIHLRSFSAASVLTLAVQHPSVLRLTHTWALITDPASLNSLYNLKKLFLLPLQNPREGYSEYWTLQRAINPPFIPFFRIILEDIAFVGTNPEDPTLTTRTYQCQVKNDRIYGQHDGPHPQVKALVEFVNSAKEGSYPAVYDPILEKYLENFPLFTNDQAYDRSRVVQPREPAKQQAETESHYSDYLPYVLVGLTLIGTGLYFFRHNSNK